MSHSFQPGSGHHSDSIPRRGRSYSFPVLSIVREYGFRGVVALVVSALLAFSPLALLVWFNLLSWQSVITLAPGQTLVVKPGRYEREQEQDEPGETALLQVICEVPKFDGWRTLLCDEDPVRRGTQAADSFFVRRERVYLRRAGDFSLPFGLLGKPPVSAWLPAGDYEIMVVHEAPRSEPRIDAKASTYPLVSAFAECTLEKQQKTVCRVRLPHYDWGGGEPLALASRDNSTRDRAVSESELRGFTEAIEQTAAVGTPGGYLLILPEPQIRHTDEHRQCSVDFADLRVVPHEWTREQIASVRNWLPENAAAARQRLGSLVDALQWREFLEGWYCYAAAGIAGLVFTKWGAMAMLQPSRRRESFFESLKLLTSIFFISLGLWFLFSVLTGSSGCGGPVAFRVR